MQYVIFQLAGEDFGIPVTQVREVIQVPDISFLPGVPDFIEGVITIRRHSVMVMDLYKRLNIAQAGKSSGGFVLIVSIEGMIVGLLVDSVREVIVVDDSLVDAANKVASSYLDTNAISGIAHAGERTIVMLNVKYLLRPEERGALASFGKA